MSFSALAEGQIGPESLQAVVAKTELGFWNTPGVQSGNNCYNYSTNRVTNNFAQPGQASGIRLSSLQCDRVIAAASADLGLTPATYAPFNGREDDTLIALVVAPNYDYHWYRRDSDGMWSHKPGGTKATNKDNAGALITDPETAARGPYRDFCGYFRVKNFPKAIHEQDGGYVRVGNMRALPSLAGYTSPVDTTPTPVAVPLPALTANDSFVEVQMYSGLENPRISLQEYFSRPANNDVLSKVVPLVQASITDLSQQNVRVSEASQLGKKTIVIHDGQGLMFPIGTNLEIRAHDVVVELPNRDAYSVLIPSGTTH